MSHWLSTYGVTETGRHLVEIIDQPEHFATFVMLSEQGKPAVQAVANEVAAIIDALPSKKERDAACQFVGWYVGQIMREAGYVVVQDRGRVSDAPYKTGAVWALGPVEPKLTLDSPPMLPQGRIQLTVSTGENGVVADWELTTSDKTRSGTPRRVHRIMSVKKPIAAAVAEVIAYARRHGHAQISIVDNGNHYPKTDWPKTNR
jgi:CubicO group peptidase (beta-lactamase class C family)